MIMEMPNYNMMQDITKMICDDLVRQLDDAFIEGLRLKGFDFFNKFELELFIKERCRCEDNIDLKERVYYVDNIPFFLHNYKSEIISNPEITRDPCKVVGELGTFAYL